MTLRKFFRFFKHFGYYMKKDIRWLKDRRIAKKNAKLEKKNAAIKAKEQAKQEKKYAGFVSELNRIYSVTKVGTAILKRHKYYIPYASDIRKFAVIWRTGNIFHTLVDGIEKTFDLGPDDNGKHPAVDKIKENFGVVTDFRNDDTMFALEICDMNNSYCVEESGVYKIYQISGKQKPRLMLTISSDLFGSVKVKYSRGQSTQVLKMTHDPAEVIKRYIKMRS